MSPVGSILSALLWIFLLILFFRLIMEWVFVLSRSYRPHGIMAIALEVTYTITDPPLRLLRRVIPPLRIGGFALDLAFFLLVIVVYILISVAQRL